MKKTGLKILAYTLCAVLLLGALAPQILAANGPLQEKIGDFYTAYIELMRLDETGAPLNYDESGFPIPDMLFENNEAVPGVEGAVYDKATNTLTLTNFNGAYTWLTTNAMGDDFTIVVHGNCALNGITVWGWGHGSGLHIEGDGTLTVNGIKEADCAITFVPEDTTPQLSFGKNVNVNLYGKECVVYAEGAVTTNASSLIKAANGQTYAVKAKKAVREVKPSLRGYSNFMKWSIAAADCATDTDKNHKYELKSGTRTWSDGRKEEYVEVCRYIYVEKYDVYLKDYAWAQSQGGEADVISFDSLEDAAKAGYTKRMTEYGYQVWEEINYCGSHGSENLYEDDAGNQYVVVFTFEDTELVEYAATIEALEEPEGEYIFIINKNIDVSTLKELIETRTYDDIFDIEVPQKELIYKGSAASQRMLGDVDNNGKVEAADARLALRGAVGLETYAAGSADFIAADADKNNKLEAADARLILRAAVGLETLA